MLMTSSASMQASLRDYLHFATETAYLAGRLTLGYFQAGVQADLKADETPVTVADRKAEELMRGRIEARYPRHGILGEEYGEKEGEEGVRWILDPIDGTKAFMRGVPLYGVLVGLELGGSCEVGVAYFPALDEMVHAASGEGCFLNGRPVRVLPTESLAQGIVSCTDPGSFTRYGREGAWERLASASYHRAGWSDAYGHALVATGRLELMLDPVMNPWDCAPFPPILREAGGFFGNWSGEETIYGGEALSTSRTLLPEVLELIQGEV